MSLSLTPINEAWQIQKIKKPKIQNSFSNHDTQVKLLRENNHQIQPTNIIPSGSNLSEKNYKPVANSQEAVSQPKIDSKSHLLINFDNPLVIDYLSKYKESFAKTLIEELIINSISKPPEIVQPQKVETFIDDNDNSLIIIIVLASVLLYSVACDN